MQLENQSSKRSNFKTDTEVAEILKTCAESGLTQKGFYLKNNLKLSTFHSWKKRLKHKHSKFIKVGQLGSDSGRYQLILKNGILEFSGIRLSEAIKELRESRLC